jgi:hypothetical protein
MSTLTEQSSGKNAKQGRKAREIFLGIDAALKPARRNSYHIIQISGDVGWLVPWGANYASARNCRHEKNSTAPKKGINTHPAFASGTTGGVCLSRSLSVS